MFVGMLSRSSLVPRFGGLVSRRFTSLEVHPQPIVVSRLPDSPGIALIQFHRPEKMNAMNIEMGEAFEHAVQDLSKDETLRAVVISGSGKAFSAGGDYDFLLARASVSPAENAREMRAFYSRFLSVRTLPVPVISAINGHAVGAGLCLALATDIRIAYANAKLGVNFTQLNLSPGMGGTFFLPRVAGPQVANYLMLTGGIITAERAKELGLVLECCSDRAETLERALEIAKQIASAGPLAVRATVQSLRQQHLRDLEIALQREADAQAQCYADPEYLQRVKSL